MNEPNLSRLETKVDDLSKAIGALILFEERQAVQAVALAALSMRVTAHEKKLDMWINRGVGVWALALTLFTIFKTLGLTL